MKAAAERMAINAPIQGTEADIIKLAMVEIDKFLTQKDLKGDARMLLQVHDELVFEVKEGIVGSVAPEIKRMMEGVIDPKKTAGIVMLAEACVGDNWAETKKIL
jgi:DNA polymerase-1